MSDPTPQERVEEIMRDTRIAVLTYQDDEGRLVSTPMGTQDFEDSSTVYFITEVATNKVAAIEQRPAVNVSYASDKGWVSLSGNAKLNRDRDKLKELWDPSVSFFMEGDADDPNNAILEVNADTAEYWESPGKAAMVVGIIKGVVGGKGDKDLGDSGVVDL